MAFYDHQQAFAGYTVKQWTPGEPLQNLETTAYRISVNYEDEQSFSEKFAQYMNDPSASQTKAFVVGQWNEEAFENDSSEARNALVEAAQKLPHLHALFFGDITMEECEVSWLHNTDLAPLFKAYPGLTHFATRGGNALEFSELSSDKLQLLIIQSGGLSGTLVKQVAQATLPALQHLELYLGTDEYGASYSLDDLKPILSGQSLPALTYLGLRNAEDQDNIAKTVVQANILPQLEVLDLSLGTLSDEGGEALLQAVDKLRHLKKLDLHRHYLSDEMMERLNATGINVDVSEQEDIEDDWRYVAIGE